MRQMRPLSASSQFQQGTHILQNTILESTCNTIRNRWRVVGVNSTNRRACTMCWWCQRENHPGEVFKECTAVPVMRGKPHQCQLAGPPYCSLSTKRGPCHAASKEHFDNIEVPQARCPSKWNFRIAWRVSPNYWKLRMMSIRWILWLLSVNTVSPHTGALVIVTIYQLFTARIFLERLSIIPGVRFFLYQILSVALWGSSFLDYTCTYRCSLSIIVYILVPLNCLQVYQYFFTRSPSLISNQLFVYIWS